MSTWGGYSSWSEHDVTRGDFLVTPVRLLWRSYLGHCQDWGFEPAPAEEFVHWLRGEEGVRIVQGGQGRVRRMAVGMAPSRVIADHGGRQDGGQREATWRRV